MNILLVASEATPLIKVGGLADVVGALPKAFSAAGHEARILLPRYGVLIDHGYADTSTGLRFSVPWQSQSVPVELFQGVLPGSETIVYTLAADALFAGGAYVSEPSAEGFRHQMERFTFFSWATAHLLQQFDWQPDIVHCHDWHAAGIPFLTKILGTSPASVVTIHNIESQGKWSPVKYFPWLGLRGDELPSLSVRDPLGDFNVLQQAIINADAVTTVSPTYAQEILRPEYGFGLEETLRARSGGVVGITNGIDTDRFNPATDAAITRHYDAVTAAEGKVVNRAALAKLAGWSDSARPILGVVSRLTEQKGIDLLLAALPTWLEGGGRVVILGTGQPELEQHLQTAAQAHPESIKIQLGFDAALAQQIYGGSDFFAMPSKFEPCGLGQLIAMRYGSLPVVRDTGGLHDTVIDVFQNPDHGTGIVFGPYSKAAMAEALRAALRLWSKQSILKAARRRAMLQDFSWTTSAAAYLQVYANIKPR